jgi:tetratricopeptide (TPR) repeat protein|eukprot:COSAG06_NODE_2228_length_7296_cov_12.770321_6_plen_614_part_00
MRLALVLALLAAAALSDSAAGRSMMPAGKKLPKAGKKAPATGAGTKGADSDDAKAAPDAGAGAPGGASGLTSEKDEMVEEAAALVEAGQFEEAESLLLDVGRLTKKSKSRALFESLKGQVALGYEPEGKSRRDEALAAFRKAVKLGPKDPVHKMRLARLLLADVHGCTSGCPSGSDKFAEEAGELIGKVLRSGVSGREKLEARLIQVRVLRADAGRTEGTAKQAEETLTELIQSTGLNKENLDVAGPEDVDLYCRMMLESGHLYLQHSMFNNAVQMYQQAHDAAPANSRIKAEGQQGGANCMAKNAKCDKGAKAADCGKALNLFKEVPNQFVTGDAWWMRGQIHKNVYDDIQPAMEAMVAACARVDYNAAWWDKLARWSQMLHHRLPSGGFDNHAIKQGRDAMQRNHELNPYSAPQWEEKVPTILEEQAASGTAPGDFQCKNPIPQKGEGFLEEDSLEQSVRLTLRAVPSRAACVRACFLCCLPAGAAAHCLACFHRDFAVWWWAYMMPGRIRSCGLEPAFSWPYVLIRPPAAPQAFTLYNHDPDYTCESITVEEALQNFDKLVDRHRPVIIKDATASWPFPPSGESASHSFSRTIANRANTRRASTCLTVLA